MNPVTIFLIAFGTLAFVTAMMAVRIVRPYEKGLVERLGKFQRILNPGLPPGKWKTSISRHLTPFFIPRPRALEKASFAAKRSEKAEPGDDLP